MRTKLPNKRLVSRWRSFIAGTIAAARLAQGYRTEKDITAAREEDWESVSSGDESSTAGLEPIVSFTLMAVLYSCYDPLTLLNDMRSLDNSRAPTYLGTCLARTQVALRTWLEALEAVDVDLEVYGGRRSGAVVGDLELRNGV